MLAKSKYDDKCDVFSFATLLWEILALKVAYKGYSRREYMERVVQHKERLVIYRQWPALTKLLISEAWEHDPKKRPDMKRMSAMIRGDLNELSNDDMVQNRTSHMRQRSLHSFRGSSRLKSTPEPLDIVNATSNNTSESEGEAKEEA